MIVGVPVGGFMEVWIELTNKRTLSLVEVRMMYVHADCIKLTLAGLHALKPPVSLVFIVGTSALLKPSTTGSATTFSAGFLERAACWAHHLIVNRRGDDWRGDRRVDY